MTNVHASIQLLVDFHSHDGRKDTEKLAALQPQKRQAFMRRCANALYKERLADFVQLLQSDDFQPTLQVENGTRHPSLKNIRAKLVAAVKAYNDGDFGMTFDPELPAVVHDAPHDVPHGAKAKSAPVVHAATGDPLPPFSCIQWVWINGEKVAKYNYELVDLSGNAPTEGELQARYRVSITYTRGIAEPSAVNA